MRNLAIKFIALVTLFTYGGVALGAIGTKVKTAADVTISPSAVATACPLNQARQHALLQITSASATASLRCGDSNVGVSRGTRLIGAASGVGTVQDFNTGAAVLCYNDSASSVTTSCTETDEE